MKPQQLKQIAALLVATTVALVPSCGSREPKTMTVATTGAGPTLLAAGFRVRSVATAPQREQLKRMPPNVFTVVRQGDETYYLYPDNESGRLYAGNHYAHREYVRNMEMQRTREQGVVVIQTQPRGTPVEVWQGWAPFREW